MTQSQALLRPVINAVAFQRFYADGNTPQATSNVSGNPQSGSPEEKQTNSGAGGSRGQTENTASASKPVSEPGGVGLGGQEEPQPGQGHVKPDKNKPDHEKREEVLKEGEKPLDPADK